MLTWKLQHGYLLTLANIFFVCKWSYLLFTNHKLQYRNHVWCANISLLRVIRCCLLIVDCRKDILCRVQIILQRAVCWCLFIIKYVKRENDGYTTSYQRRCNVMTRMNQNLVCTIESVLFVVVTYYLFSRFIHKHQTQRKTKKQKKKKKKKKRARKKVHVTTLQTYTLLNLPYIGTILTERISSIYGHNFKKAVHISTTEWHDSRQKRILFMLKKW